MYDGELIVGEYFGISRFDGTSWVTLGGGMSDAEVVAAFGLRIYNGDLIVAGSFNRVGGFPGVIAHNIAALERVGLGRDGRSAIDAVVSITEHRGELACGGWFTQAGGGPAGSFARWTDTGVPWIAVEPEPQSVDVGETPMFSVTPAHGYSELTYQWRRNGAPITDGRGGAFRPGAAS